MIDFDVLSQGPAHPYDRYVHALNMTETYQAQIDTLVRLGVDIFQSVCDPNTPTLRLEQPILMMLSFIRAGRNTFEMSQEMYDLFDRTDLSNIPWDMVAEPPYPAFYVDLQACNLWMTSVVDMLPVRVDGVFVVMLVKDGVHHIRGMLWSREKKTGTISLPRFVEAGKHSHWSMVPLSPAGLKGIANNPLVDACAEVGYKDKEVRSMNAAVWHDSHMTFGFDSGELDVETTLGIVLKHTAERGRVQQPNMTEEGALLNAHAAEKAIRCVINTILFLGWGGATVSDGHHSERKRIRRLLDGNLTAKNREKYSKLLLSLGTTNVRLLDVEPHEKTAQTDGVRSHWVRGHWRKQPYGPKDTPSYKMLWIRPHKRGSVEVGETEARTYKIQSGGE